MEPEGFRTLLASSGEEALDIVREADVHLALLDMHMPTLDRTGDVAIGAADQGHAAGHPDNRRRRREPDSSGLPDARLQRYPQAGQQERGAVHRAPRLGGVYGRR